MLPVDKFFENVLFDKEKGYYSSKLPFGIKGDFITSPGITNLFSELKNQQNCFFVLHGFCQESFKGAWQNDNFIGSEC